MNISSRLSTILERGDYMPNFQREFPNTARYLKQRYPDKEPLSSFWHWATLALFAILCIATIKQQLLLIRTTDPHCRIDQRTRIVTFRCALFTISQLVSTNWSGTFSTILHT